MNTGSFDGSSHSAFILVKYSFPEVPRETFQNMIL